MSAKLWNKLFLRGIKTFHWWDYGLDDIQEIIDEEWSQHLADHLEKIVADWVAGKIDV